MKEENIELNLSDGIVDSFLCHPDGEGPWPGVLLLTDIGGIRHAYKEKARRVAAEGYCVLMPNVFYRAGGLPVFDFPIVFGEERTAKRFGELRDSLPADAMEHDASDYIDFLAAQDSVGKGSMGVVGYCFTGAMALRIAAARPDRIAAVASFHGGGLFTAGPTSPHLVLPRVKAELYFGHAIEDRSMPAEAIEKFDQALAAWGGRYESEVYEGSFHSWTTEDSPAYNEPQAQRAFGKLTALLARAL